MKPEEKKVNTSVAVSPNVLEQLREYRKNSGVSISWLINTLLNNFFKNMRGKKDGQ